MKNNKQTTDTGRFDEVTIKTMPMNTPVFISGQVDSVLKTAKLYLVSSRDVLDEGRHCLVSETPDEINGNVIVSGKMIEHASDLKAGSDLLKNSCAVDVNDLYKTERDALLAFIAVSTPTVRNVELAKKRVAEIDSGKKPRKTRKDAGKKKAKPDQALKELTS